ncbi:histidinol dehydrogenase [Paraliomyxa miuraensis]|uniref:histidinol dehydrogenase n=1 Tax=Paraliomyxa miuraensis TaxID=376150 RepID=UPI002250ABA7|nr:histidinol dehydrogenase [Paraliomyxa miuraensis]MCX4243827.1 histidinol dehydrogenase [Paraliomyxa miuraensis]
MSASSPGGAPQASVATPPGSLPAAFEGLPRIDLRPGPDGAPPTGRLAWRERCARAAGLAGEADEAARAIIADVRARGDAAVVELTRRFEGRTLDPDHLELEPQRRAEACARVPHDIRAALELAARRIREFHQTQRHPTTGLERDGERLHSRVAPLRRVAVYAPGGTAAYPSSVLMAGIPAKVAGVDEVLLLTPRANDVVLLAAELAGIDRVFEIGGAQAIAAAALGTERVPRVDKIVGPGNAYVTAAKRQVYGLCDIDGIAGPSEILVVADATADAEFVAADLISQAEHDRLACAVLVTDHPPLIDATDAALRRQLVDLPRRELATLALVEHGAAVLVEDRDALARTADEYAPEHLELLVDRPEAMASDLRGAGAIFVGPWTPEAAGDYTAGPSHVLPTAGAARFGSPLGVWDFVKHTSVLALGHRALVEQAKAIVTLARAEGLEGHARAVERRLAEGRGR